MRPPTFTMVTEFFSCLVIICLIFPVAAIVAPEVVSAPDQATGTLHIDGSPVGMEIMLDGRVAGQVADSGVLVIDNIPVGLHDVMASFPGYESQEVQVNVPGGLTAEVRIDLATQATGSIDISSTPTNVQIFVDDQYKGITPAVIEVPAGTYTVLLRLSGYQDWTSQADVTGGKTTVLSGTLLPTSGGPVPTASSGPSFMMTLIIIVSGCIFAALCCQKGRR
ncbi:MAG TPA: PEGA domain-containing protein [Methanospirillum sp.]|nr:PEGA domain-containing protein [Methanospirillum sp.]